MNATLTNDSKLCRVTVPADLVSTTADDLRHQLTELLENEAFNPEWRILELDLSQAHMVDSMGLNLIVTILRATQRINRKLQIRLTSPNVLRTFQFTRLNQHIELIKV